MYTAAWGEEKKEHLCLDGEPWVVSHVGGECGCIWGMTYSITKSLLFLYKRNMCSLCTL